MFAPSIRSALQWSQCNMGHDTALRWTVRIIIGYSRACCPSIGALSLSGQPASASAQPALHPGAMQGVGSMQLPRTMPAGAIGARPAGSIVVRQRWRLVFGLPLFAHGDRIHVS